MVRKIFVIALVAASVGSLAVGAYRMRLREQRAALEVFLRTTRSDPLFYDSLLDTEALRSALEELKHQETDTLDIIEYSSTSPQSPLAAFKVWDVWPSLFPTGYLSEVAAVIDETRAFLDAPTLERGRSLLVRYENALGSQRDFISERERILAMVRERLGKTEPPAIISLGSHTSLATVEADIALVARNIDALGKEIEKRKHCLLKRRCGELSPLDPQATAPLVPSAQTPALLPLSIVYKEPHAGARGPYMASSPCWENLRGITDQAAPLYVIVRDSGRGSREMHFKIASENYYWDMTRGRTAYDRFLASRGIRWNQQLETEDYLCADHEFRFQLSLLDDFIERLKSDGSVFSADTVAANRSDLEAATLMTEARRMEETLLRDPPAHVGYVERMAWLYRVIEKRGIRFPSRAARERFVDLRLALENKLVRLPNLIASIVTSMETYKIVLLMNADTPADLSAQPYYLFLVRSQPTFFAFPVSISFWRIPERLRYTDGALGTIPDPVYKTYHELKDIYGAETAEGFLFDERHFLRNNLPADFWYKNKRFFSYEK